MGSGVGGMGGGGGVECFISRRLCKICTFSDESDDPCDPTLPGRRWGYPVRIHLAPNQGMICWYCTKIFEARYKYQHKLTITALPRWLGEDQQRLERFKFLLAKGIEWLKEHSADGRTPWASFEAKFEQELIVRNRREVSLEEPADNWMYADAYTRIYGEPGCNGLGHTRQMLGGKDIVVLPGSGVGILKRATKFQADVQQKIASSDFALTGADQLQDMQRAFLSGMMEAPSTGVSLDSLLGNSGASGSGPNQRWKAPANACPPQVHQAQSMKSEKADGAGQEKAQDASASSERGWFFDMMQASPSQSAPSLAGQLQLQHQQPQPQQHVQATEKTETPVKKRRTAAQTASPDHTSPAAAGTIHGRKKPGKGKGKGRPKGDRVAAAQKILDDLVLADEGDPTHFGKGRAANLRMMQRVHDDLKAASSVAEDAATFNLLNTQVKKMSASIEVIKVVNTKGTTDKSFFETMTAQLHFLKLEPVCTCHLPRFLHFAYLCLKAESADGPEFWRLVGKGNILDEGKVADGEFGKKQEEIIGNKVLKISKMATSDEAMVTLRKVFGVEIWKETPGSYVEQVKVASSFLHVIVAPEKHTIPRIAEAIKASRGPEAHPIVALLNDFPRGRAIVDVLQADLGERSDATKWVSKWTAALGTANTKVDMQDPLSQELVSIDHFADVIAAIGICNKILLTDKPSSHAEEAVKATFATMASCASKALVMGAQLMVGEVTKICEGRSDTSSCQVELASNIFIFYIL